LVRSFTDEKIDEIVYELYGITEKDRKRIERDSYQGNT
jgi:hypothetical protein